MIDQQETIDSAQVMRNQHMRRLRLTGWHQTAACLLAIGCPVVSAVTEEEVIDVPKVELVPVAQPVEKKRFRPLRNMFKKEPAPGPPIGSMFDAAPVDLPEGIGLPKEEGPSAEDKPTIESKPEARATLPEPEIVTEAEEPEKKKRRRLLKWPFGRKGEEETGDVPAEAPQEGTLPKDAPSEETPPGEDTVLVEADVPDTQLDPAPAEKKRKKLLGFGLFGKGRDKSEPEATSDTLAAVGEDAVGDQHSEAAAVEGAGVEELVVAEPVPQASKGRRRLLPGLFGKKEKRGEVAEIVPPAPEPEPGELVADADDVEVQVSEDMPKRGLFGLFGRGKKGRGDGGAPLPHKDIGRGAKYVVTQERTPFFAIGPAQPLPPEAILPMGAVVTMRTSGWGWSDVTLGDGQMGVISSKNLRRASAGEAGGSYASRRRSSRGLWKVLDFNPKHEPDLPSGSGGMQLGAGLLPSLDGDD